MLPSKNIETYVSKCGIFEDCQYSNKHMPLGAQKTGSFLFFERVMYSLDSWYSLKNAIWCLVLYFYLKNF